MACVIGIPIQTTGLVSSHDTQRAPKVETLDIGLEKLRAVNPANETSDSGANLPDSSMFGGPRMDLDIGVQTIRPGA